MKKMEFFSLSFPEDGMRRLEVFRGFSLHCNHLLVSEEMDKILDFHVELLTCKFCQLKDGAEIEFE